MQQGTFECLLCGRRQLTAEYQRTEWGQYLHDHHICFDCGERLQYDQLPPAECPPADPDFVPREEDEDLALT